MLYKDMEINEEHKFNSYGIYVLTELSISGASCIFTNKLTANADIKIIVDDGALNYFQLMNTRNGTFTIKNISSRAHNMSLTKVGGSRIWNEREIS